MIERARRIAESRHFQNAILAVILLTAVLIGLETSDDLATRYRSVFDLVEMAVQTIFVVEIAIRMLAYWPRVFRFFADGWNLFDFAVVTASFLPQAGPIAVIARLARLLRVARLVSLFPELRLIVSTMLRSIPSMGHVILMLGLLLYVYGVLGVYAFRDQDPERWGSLGAAFLTLFQILTLEGWVEVQAAAMAGNRWAWVYFASFVIVAVFVVVNLFIAVVLNNLDEIRHEDRQAALAEEERLRPEAERGFEQHLAALRAELDRLEAHYRRQRGGR